MQYVELLETEGVELEFHPGRHRRVARLAQEVNERTENIGARRLHTIMERLLEDISFRRSRAGPGERVVIDRTYVREKPARRRRPISTLAGTSFKARQLT